jgi:hypothetical protein
MKDLDNLKFFKLDDKYPEIRKLIKDNRYVGIYNSELDEMAFKFINDCDPTYNQYYFKVFIFTVNHEFMHRILNHFIDYDACNGFDNFTNSQSHVDFEGLLE